MGVNLLAVVAMSPALPVIVRTGMSIPALTLTTNMACKVYRSTRLGLIQDDLSLPSVSSAMSRPLSFLHTSMN